MILSLGTNVDSVVTDMVNFNDKYALEDNFVCRKYNGYTNIILKARTNLSRLNLKGVAELPYLFSNNTVRHIDLSETDLGSVIDFTGFFLDFSGSEILFDTFGLYNEIRKMSSMFEGCANIKELDLSMFNFKYVYEYENTFKGCVSLEKIYVATDEDRTKIKKILRMSDLPNVSVSIKKLDYTKWKGGKKRGRPKKQKSVS